MGISRARILACCGIILCLCLDAVLSNEHTSVNVSILYPPNTSATAHLLDGLPISCSTAQEGLFHIKFPGCFVLNAVSLHFPNTMLNETVFIDAGIASKDPKDQHPPCKNISMVGSDLTAGGRCRTIQSVTDIVIYTNSKKPLTLCELHLQAYEFIDCASTKGRPMYGPGCLLPCNCDSQCDEIAGTCDTSCLSGYYKDPSGACVRCADGFWGVNCTYICSCRNTSEPCFSEDGSCASGCPDGYASAGCRYKLPSFANIQHPRILRWEGRQVELEVNRTITLNHTIDWHVLLKPNTFKDMYVTELKIQHVSKDCYVLQFVLPAVPDGDYELCLVPYDLSVRQYGPSSPCIYIHNPLHKAITNDKLKFEVQENGMKLLDYFMFALFVGVVMLFGFLVMYMILLAKMRRITAHDEVASGAEDLEDDSSV